MSHFTSISFGISANSANYLEVVVLQAWGGPSSPYVTECHTNHVNVTLASASELVAFMLSLTLSFSNDHNILLPLSFFGYVLIYLHNYARSKTFRGCYPQTTSRWCVAVIFRCRMSLTRPSAIKELVTDANFECNEEGLVCLLFSDFMCLSDTFQRVESSGDG